MYSILLKKLLGFGEIAAILASEALLNQKTMVYLGNDDCLCNFHL
jgi:hypothetical protein